MKEISNINLIAQRDPTAHLSCLKEQIFTYVSSMDNNYSLLLSRALEPTNQFFKHCYIAKKNRWSFQSDYIKDIDLEYLGFSQTKATKLAINDFYPAVRECIEADQPVFFHAPRNYFPYWVEHMVNAGKPHEEYSALHSFMVCGINVVDNEIIIVDTDFKGGFKKYLIPKKLIMDGYNQQPERWFLDCSTLSRKEKEIKSESILESYFEHIEAYQDDFILLDLIESSFEFEKKEYLEKDTQPYINSLALLAGSRLFFSWFINMTTHSNLLKKTLEKNSDFLVSLFEIAETFHKSGTNQNIFEIKLKLKIAKKNEEKALELIKDESKKMDIKLLTRQARVN